MYGLFVVVSVRSCQESEWSGGSGKRGGGEAEVGRYSVNHLYCLRDVGRRIRTLVKGRPQ